MKLKTELQLKQPQGVVVTDGGEWKYLTEHGQTPANATFTINGSAGITRTPNQTIPKATYGSDPDVVWTNGKTYDFQYVVGDSCVATSILTASQSPYELTFNNTFENQDFEMQTTEIIYAGQSVQINNRLKNTTTNEYTSGAGYNELWNKPFAGATGVFEPSGNTFPHIRLAFGGAYVFNWKGMIFSTTADVTFTNITPTPGLAVPRSVYSISDMTVDVVWAQTTFTVKYFTLEAVITPSVTGVFYNWYKDNKLIIANTSNNIYKTYEPGLYKCEATLPVSLNSCVLELATTLS